MSEMIGRPLAVVTGASSGIGSGGQPDPDQ
jgi:NADP-dependent 3-hydroxy acid dehydrogenase YdfG